MRIIIGSFNFPAAGRTLAELLPGHEVVPCAEADLAAEARQAEVLIPTMARIGPEIITGSSLRLIHQWGVGLEGVDIAAASAAGIAVCNVPAEAADANAESTAEQALFLMMATARRFNQSRGNLRQGPWGAPQGLALMGRRALIVGLGMVGTALARRLIALGMQVCATKAHPDPALAAELGLAALAGPEDLPAELAQADFVISTLTATPRTLGLFNAAAFEAMPAGAFFINVSRGGVVDEAALKAALDQGHLGGAGLDVFAVEPVDPAHPLLDHPRVVAMPHTGGVTVQSFAQIGRQVAANIERLEQGLPLLHQVN